MPDLTYHPARWCAGNEVFEKTVEGSVGTYEVTFNRFNPGEYSCNWACTCPGFKFRGTCKHVKEAESEKCDYGWGASCGSPEPDEVWGEGPEYTCPECGGPTSVMEFAA